MTCLPIIGQYVNVTAPAVWPLLHAAGCGDDAAAPAVRVARYANVLLPQSPAKVSIVQRVTLYDNRNVLIGVGFTDNTLPIDDTCSATYGTLCAGAFDTAARRMLLQRALVTCRW